MGLWAVLFGRKKGYPIEIVGMFQREQDDETASRSMEYHTGHAEEHDVIGDLWLYPNHNVFITGVSGNSGKSTFAEALVNEITSPEECKKYGLENPVPAVIFSPKKFDSKKSIDFDLGGRFRILDCNKVIPNPFEDKEAFVSCWEVLVVNSIDNKGITASQIAEATGIILSESTCKSWEDFRHNLEKIKKRNYDGILSSQLNWISNKIQYLDVKATVADIPTSNVIYYLGGLPSKARAFYYELFLQKLVRELEEEWKSETAPLLVLDEAHLILKHQFSIISRYLRELRTHVSAIFVISQNIDDCDPQLLQFAKIFCGKTEHLDKFSSKPTIKECVSKIQPRQFVDFTFTGTNNVPVYSLSKKAVEKIKALKENNRKEIGVIKEALVPEVIAVSAQGQTITQSENKVDAKELEGKIINLLENEPRHQYDIGSKLGYARDDAKGRLAVKNALKKLLAEKRISKMDYVVEKKGVSPRKIFYTNKNKTETSAHERGVNDTKKVVEKIEPVISEYRGNQSWDLESSTAYCDFKTGLQHSFQDDVRKLKDPHYNFKPIIFVCANYNVKTHYENTLSVVDGIEGKYFVCCLDTLIDVIRNFKK